MPPLVPDVVVIPRLMNPFVLDLTGNDAIQLSVAGAPVAYRRAVHLRNGNVYNPNGPAQARFREVAASSLPWGFVPFTNKLSIRLTFVCSTTNPNNYGQPGGRADIDNYVKFVLDAGNGFFFDDDSQVCHLVAQKVYGADPCTMVAIFPLA